VPPAEARLEETGIFLVMAFELLVGSGKIRGGGQLRRRMEKKLKILKKGFNDAGGKGMGKLLETEMIDMAIEHG